MAFLLFTQQGCKPCEMAKRLLMEKKMRYKEIDIKLHPEFTRKSNIKSTPTLICYDNSNEIQRFVGPRGIQKL